LPRTTFDALLLEASARAGAEVREQVVVDDLIFDSHGAVAGVAVREPANGRREMLRAKIVIGADGLNSIVARKLGLAWRGVPRRIAYTAHVADVAGVRDFGELHVSRSGYVGLGPIGGGVTTVALVLPLASSRSSRAQQHEQFFAELEGFPGLKGRFDPERLTRPILVTGPFARSSRRSVAPEGGALLVGDAADFFDPFTGQGIYSALRGAELASRVVIAALERGVSFTAHTLEPYRRLRRKTFATKWILERLIGLGVGSPAVTDRVVSRLERRPDLADLMVGATGNFVPAGAVLRPRVLARLLI